MLRWTVSSSVLFLSLLGNLSAVAQESAPAAAPSTASSAAPAAAAASKPHEGWAPLTPLGLEDVAQTAPDDNPITKPKWLLGKTLFWDKRMSGTGTHACVTCHMPEKGWTDGKQFSTKADGKVNTRHTPTLYNLAYNNAFYWDGRAATLEKNVLAAWEGQMGATSLTAVLAKKLGEIPGYKVLFADAFPDGGATPERVAKALATFIRTITAGDSPYDAFANGKADGMSEAAKRGWDLFRTKARCATCHSPGLFTDHGFHNLGIGGGAPDEDIGYGKTIKAPSYNGAFKTPTLRNVLAHPPFSHTGQFRNLGELLKYFEQPYAGPNLDPFLKGGIHLTESEQADLTAFLEALEGSEDPRVLSKPDLP